MKNSQPHDGLAKACLSDLSIAKEILQQNLPISVVEKIRWETLHLPNKSFVDKKLNQYHADVLYGFKVGDQDAYASVEHISSADCLQPFHQLVYNVLVMKQHISAGNKYPPLVFNICIYAGPTSPYPYSFDVFDCFQEPALARQVLFKAASAMDLTVIPEEALAVYEEGCVYLLLLKQGVYKSFLNWVELHPIEIVKLHNGKYGSEGISYMLKLEQGENANLLLEKLQSLDPANRILIMSAAQKFIDQGTEIGLLKGEGIGMEKGIEKGIEKGKQEKAIEVARNLLLHLSLDINSVQKATGISKSELEKILQGNR